MSNHLSPARMSLWRRLMERLRHKADYRWLHWPRVGEHQQADYLRRLFALLEVDLVIDVGANRGQFADFIRGRVGYSGALLSFEPIAEHAKALARRAQRDAAWNVRPTALGAHRHTAEFQVMKSSPMSSLLKPSTSDTQQLSHFNTIARTQAVQVETLDECVAAHGHFRNIYLKLDVQGYEQQVLEGAVMTLSRVAALQSELSVVPLYQDQPQYLSLMSHIEALGFVPSLIPSHNPEHFPLLIDFDCHFVSRARLAALGLLNRG